MAEPFIKLYRKMLKWEWYDDPNTFRLFIHCLLRANWQETSWHGVTLQPGQFITSTANLAKETHLTVKQVRVALDHLISTGEVASKGQSKFRIITVLKWDEYQREGKQTADKGQAEGKQRATDKEYKEIKKERNIYSAPKKSAQNKFEGQTRKYSHEFFEAIERENENAFRTGN